MYFGYPLVLIFLGTLRRHPVKKAYTTPSVTIIVSAYNEEKFISRKLDELLSLEYPREKLQIIVVSDGSTDQTNAILEGYAHKGVELCPLKAQLGKTAAQNEGVRHAKGEILFFTDVTAFLGLRALREIVANFADERVGCVSGRFQYGSLESAATKQGLGLYARYEVFIRRNESDFYYLLGASGCIYAIRKDLYKPLREDLVSDLLAPLSLLRDGYRTAYEEKALAQTERKATLKTEFMRRSRTALQALRILWHVRDLFNPLQYPFVAFALFSRRLLRLLMPVFFISTFVINLFLLPEKFYTATLLIQMMFYLSAAIGYGLEKLDIKAKVFNIPLFLCVMNLAALYAYFRLLKGEKAAAWKTIRL
jgi:cellulose synthase/poly-beta-1,6-N-acetylglucosamine synthase-like glycosyltransferase